MAKYEVQFWGELSKQWLCDGVTDDLQIALDKIKLLNRSGSDARVIIYDITSKEIHEYYIEKEVNKCEK